MRAQKKNRKQVVEVIKAKCDVCGDKTHPWLHIRLVMVACPTVVLCSKACVIAWAKQNPDMAQLLE